MSTPTGPAAPQGTPKAKPPVSGELLVRVESLEQANRRLKRQGQVLMVVTAVLLGVAVALVYTAAQRGMPGFTPQVVESREFILRDRDGRVRGAWGQDREGAIRFVLQDARNQTSIKLNLLDDGSSGLTFADSAGNARLIVAVLPDETINLVFADGRGIARTVLGLNARGGSTLVFGDGGGTTRAAIGVDNRGRPVLTTGPAVAAEPQDDEPDTAQTNGSPARRR